MNIILTGPNGCGKGAIASAIKKAYDSAHIEVGALFQYHLRKETKLGLRAKEFIELGELVPDEITIPMIMDCIQKEKYYSWVLDGYSRTKEQAVQLEETLRNSFELDLVIELFLNYEECKKRIMGRRICIKDSTHQNNVNIFEIKPNKDRCNICGGEIIKRLDDSS